MLRRYCLEFSLVTESLKHNGPAIKGVCVTRRSIRVESGLIFSQYAVTVREGYGVVFAVRVQNLKAYTRVAVQIRLHAVLSLSRQIAMEPVSGRGTIRL